MRAAVALALLLMTTTASAADDNPVFVRIGAGAGRFRARQPAAGDSVLGSITQTGYALELSVGANLRRFTLAATLLEHIVTFSDSRWEPTHPLAENATSMTLATLGPSIDYHFRARGGPYVGALIGVASFANRTEDRPFGFGVAVHGGWDFPTGSAPERSAIGIGARIYYASMANDVGRLQAFSPVLQVQYTYR